jgi:hypothetical protein
MRQARPVIRDSSEGTQIDSAVADPDAVFGDDTNHWIKRRYKQLCAYGAAGHKQIAVGKVSPSCRATSVDRHTLLARANRYYVC